MKQNSIFFFLLMLLCAACQRPMFEEEDENVDDEALIPLKVSTRTESGIQIDYPAYIYAFDAENGNYVTSCSITGQDDTEFEFALLPGEYKVVAIAGVESDYGIPEKPQLGNLIEMEEGNWSGKAMMLGRSNVTVKSDAEISLDITLYYVVALVEVGLSGIPESADEVSFRLSPIYSAISFSGEYSKGEQETVVECAKGDDGIWRTLPFYIFPGSGSQTSFSITIKTGNREQTYGYTFSGRPEAKVPLKIKGNYKGQITVSGSLIAGGWDEAKEVMFDFGPQIGEEDNGNDEENDEPTFGAVELPEVGEIVDNGMVVTIEKLDEGGYDVLLMNLNEWETNEADAEELLETIQCDMWELPLKYEADRMKLNFGGENLSYINELIAADDENNPLLKVGEERYLCENANGLRSFSFKEGGTLSALGSKKIYRVRLIRWVHYETE